MFKDLEAWVNSDADPPARCDFGAILADNGVKFSETASGGIWLENAKSDGREVSLAEAQSLVLGQEESLNYLAGITDLSYIALVTAARTGRLEARQSGRIWLSTIRAVQDALEAGKLRQKK